MGAVASSLGGEDLCVSACGSRGYPPPFIPPNKSTACYIFDSSRHETLKTLKLNPASSRTKQGGDTGVALDDVCLPISVREHCRGFLLEPQAPKLAPVGYIVHEYRPRDTPQSIIVSGRAYVQCWGRMEWMSPVLQQQGVCAFAVCTRGYPVIETVQTGTYTHFGQLVTSAVCCSLNIALSGSALFLCPQIHLILRNGEKVVLVDDRLGPIRIPQAFHTDFTVVDDGRNIQMDIIFRGGGSGLERTMRTLRTCLQDYTTFNNQLNVLNVSIGYSNINGVSQESTVDLQNLVISEEPIRDSRRLVVSLPHNVFKQNGQVTHAHIVYEGRHARGAFDSLSLPGGNPQIQRLTVEQLSGAHGKTASGYTERNGKDEFWCNVKYEGEEVEELAPNHHGPVVRMRGELWMSPVLDSRHVYFQCSSTVPQALTMCIIFRFSCPIDYLRLITERASHALTHMHIPTNGIVMGVEHDPRHPALLRMFIEHRNDIMEDMVVCECHDLGHPSTRIYQEVYDAGAWICYRVTILRPDGSTQTAALQSSMEHFLDPSVLDPQDLPPYEEPSCRFPISPSLARHEMSPASRVLLYSNVAYLPRSQQHADVTPRGAGTGSGPLDQQGTATTEDWHSAGGASDNEAEPQAGEVPKAVVWSRPLVDACVLATNMEVPPFNQFQVPQ